MYFIFLIPNVYLYIITKIFVIKKKSINIFLYLNTKMLLYIYFYIYNNYNNIFFFFNLYLIFNYN